MASDASQLIRERITNAGIQVSTEQLEALKAYFGLLTKWNRTVNLTSLKLDPPAPETVDRLLIEPLLGVEQLRTLAAPLDLRAIAPVRLLDVGSGGGSPAIPLKVGLGARVELHMVESRGRKAAFLREVVRELRFEEVEVHQVRLEDALNQTSMRESFDLVSMRAVRADQGLWKTLAGLARRKGLVLWFRSAPDPAAPDSVFFPNFLLDSIHPLVAGNSQLVLLRRA